MATNTFDFDEFEQWADTVNDDGDELSDYFTTGRN